MSQKKVRVVVSGAPGRLAGAIGEAVQEADDLALVGGFNPGRHGQWHDVPYVESVESADVDVVVETGPDSSVMDNLALWRRVGVAAVVGTSGFTSARIDHLAALWGDGSPGCLVVPNFSIGAILSTRFAELAAPHFVTTEVIERHRSGKPDAPSGTALQTAGRIARVGGRSAPKSHELIAGSLGGDVEGVRVHSLRLEGLLAHQEVAMSNQGEQLSIVHHSTSYSSFGAGAVAAIRAMDTVIGVEVGLDRILGLE